MAMRHKYPYRVILYAVLMSGVLSVCAALAQTAPGTLALGAADSSYTLTPHLYITHDPQKALTWPEMVNRYRQNLKGTKAGPARTVTLPAHGVHWMEFTVQNRTEIPLWTLQLGDSGQGRTGVISRLSILRADTAKAVADRVTPTRSIPLALERGESATFLMRVEVDDGLPVTLPLFLQPAERDIAGLNYMFLTMLLICAAGGLFYFALALLRLQNGAMAAAGYFLFTGLFFFWQTEFSLHGLALSGELLPILLSVSLLCATAAAHGQHPDNDEQGTIGRLSMIAAAAASLICIFIYTLTPMDDPAMKAIFIVTPFVILGATLVVFSLRLLSAQRHGLRLIALSWLVMLAGLGCWLLGLYGILPVLLPLAPMLAATLAAQVCLSMIGSAANLKAARAEERLALEHMQREEQSLARIRQSKEAADQARLLRVLEREREIMEELRARENIRTEEMRVAKEAADEANRAKSAFLAVVSHEIRTPMTGVMGMVKLLLDSNLNKEQREHAITIQESGDSMLALLNDILDFEKIEVGRIDLESIAFDLPRLIQSIVTLMSGHAAQRKISLAAELVPGLPKQVMGDPTRLRQVLLNLTGNAIKFTPSGSVTIRVEAGEAGADKITPITFSVIDSGIGISEEAQKNLFSPFAQADSSITRKFGGTGLGLAISKGLISAMGSDIRVSSREGHGSIFYFTLPMKAVEVAPLMQTTIEAHPPAAYQPILPACRIMLVEDNEVNRRVIAGFLDKEPVTLAQIDNAEELFDILNTQNFDAILMDVELPGMRGDEATRHLRAQGLSIPVIGLTGNVSNSDVRGFYESGMDAIVGKPIDADKLKQTILRVLSERSGEQADTGITIAESPAPTSGDALDRVALQSLKDNLKPEQFDELVRGALDAAADMIEAIGAAFDEQDIAKLAAKGHELKGMAGNFGFSELSRMAGDVEQKAKQGVIDAQMAALIEDLPNAKARADAALAQWMR